MDLQHVKAGIFSPEMIFLVKNLFTGHLKQSNFLSLLFGMKMVFLTVLEIKGTW